MEPLTGKENGVCVFGESLAVIGHEALHAQTSGVYNIMIGYDNTDNLVVGPNAGTGPLSEIGWPPINNAHLAWDAWECAYCGQVNLIERETCRGCQASRPLRR